MHQLNSREEYIQFIDELLMKHPEWAEGDPYAVANGVVASAEYLDPKKGYIRNHGGAEVDERTLYPMDVIAYSRQPIQRVERRYEIDEPGVLEVDKYASCTMALDIEDRIAGLLEVPLEE